MHEFKNHQSGDTLKLILLTQKTLNTLTHMKLFEVGETTYQLNLALVMNIQSCRWSLISYFISEEISRILSV